MSKKKNKVFQIQGQQGVLDPLMDLIKEAVHKMLVAVLDEEVRDFLSECEDRRLADGRAAVVRNGYLPRREIQTGVGPVSVRIPRTRSRDGEPGTFQSALVPRYVRKTRSLEAAVPWLYLKGVSTGEMGPALEALVGPDARGLSASTVSRLKRRWSEEYGEWRKRAVDKDRWVYLWADAIYSPVRGDNPRLCILVLIGANERGEKRIVAIEDGVRESAQSWREVLLDLKSRGMNSPELVVGDGAMGLWSALEEIYPEARHQRCWVHKTANVLNCFPKSAQPKAKDKLHDIWRAETKEEALGAFDLFVEMYEAKYPKATESLEKDRRELLAFYDFPAHHWQSIRTTNPIESAFGTIRHRTRRCKGCLSREGTLHMIFKLGMCAEKNWQKMRGITYLGKVITGVKFKNGIEVSTENQDAA